MENVDIPRAVQPSDTPNPNYDMNLYLQDLEEDDLALLDKIAAQRKLDDKKLDEHPYGDLIKMNEELNTNSTSDKNSDTLNSLDTTNLESNKNSKEIEFGDQPYQEEKKNDNFTKSEDSEDNSLDFSELESGVADIENVDHTSTDFEDEFVQPQESYETEADPISVVQTLMTEERIDECIAYLGASHSQISLQP